MLTGKKLLVALLTIALVLPLSGLGLAFAGAEDLTGSTFQALRDPEADSADTDEMADALDAAEPSDEIADYGIKVDPADVIEFVYVDNKTVTLNQEQYIAFSLSDEDAVIVDAKIILEKANSEQTVSFSAAVMVDNTALFELVFSEAEEATCYRLLEITYNLADSDNLFRVNFSTTNKTISQDRTDDVIIFYVVTELIEEAAKTSTADDCNVSVFVIDDGDELVTVNSIQEALEIAQARSENSASGNVPFSNQGALSASGQADGSTTILTPLFDSLNAALAALQAKETVSPSGRYYLVIALDPGTDNLGLYEKDLNWKIAAACFEELLNYTGISPVLTRAENENASLQDRIDFAAACGASVFINISSSFGTCPVSATGSAVWVSQSASENEVQAVDEVLENKILGQLNGLGLENRELNLSEPQEDEGNPSSSLADDLEAIEASEQAGILGVIVEHALFSNLNDLAFLPDNGLLVDLGKADANAIVEQFNLVPHAAALSISSLKYRSYVETLGWQTDVYDQEVSGTTGKAKGIEAFVIELLNQPAAGSIRYAAFVTGTGWQEWKAAGQEAGSAGSSTTIQALRIELTGDMAKAYDVYYRAHVANIGWLDWAKNGAFAGSNGYGYSLEAFQVVLVPQGSSAPGPVGAPYMEGAAPAATVAYQAHVSNIGWQDQVKNGAQAGTTGMYLSIEAMRITLVSAAYSGGIEYNAHCADIGWQGWKNDNAMAGTTGQARRMESIQIRLTGEMANYYDIYYRAHVSNFGWLGWAKNGASAGSAGYAFKLEALEIRIVAKGASAPGSVGDAFRQPSYILYQAHVSNIGWQSQVADGGLAGTTGRALAMEAIRISLANPAYSGGIEYNAHCANIGWQGWKSNNAIAGTTGQVRRMEAIQIRLTGEMADYFDVYYRAHVSNFGWLGWASNGLSAGSTGYGYQLEALEIRLVPKGGAAPGSTYSPYREKDITYLTLSITVDQMVQYQKNGNPHISSLSNQELRDVIDPVSAMADYWYAPHGITYRYGIYQFADLRGYSGLTAAQLNSIIEGNSQGRSGMLRGQGAAFVAAAQTYGLNECYLLAHAVLESGWGTSTLATGFDYNGTDLINGQTYPAGTYYNFYGIGAFDSSPLSSGRAYAVRNGWDSPEKAIIGGAKWIADNYVYASSYAQPTLYAMKWDYAQSNVTHAYGWHQYATDHLWARKIARIMGGYYSELGVSPELSYIIPQYW